MKSKTTKNSQTKKESCSNCMHSLLLFNLYTCRLRGKKVLAANWCQHWDYLEDKDLEEIELFDNDDDNVSSR